MYVYIFPSLHEGSFALLCIADFMGQSPRGIPLTTWAHGTHHALDGWWIMTVNSLLSLYVCRDSIGTHFFRFSQSSTPVLKGIAHRPPLLGQAYMSPWNGITVARFHPRRSPDGPVGIVPHDSNPFGTLRTCLFSNQRLLWCVRADWLWAKQGARQNDKPPERAETVLSCNPLSIQP